MRWMLVAAAACVAFAAVAALASLDARSWRDAAGRDDGRPPATRLPADPVGRTLGLEDDLAFRRALRAFAAAPVPRPGAFDNGEAASRAVARATVALAVAAESGDPRLVSRANDLLGVLAVRSGAVDAALGRFQDAIHADAQNVNAKRNLETLVRILVDFGIRSGATAGSGRGGRGAGASPPGTGY
jgi:hypothetical protein